MSVDDFWRQLNVKKASSVRLSGLTDIPGLTRQSRTLPTQSAQLTKTTTPSPKPAVAATVPEQQHLQVRCASRSTPG